MRPGAAFAPAARVLVLSPPWVIVQAPVWDPGTITTERAKVAGSALRLKMRISTDASEWPPAGGLGTVTAPVVGLIVAPTGLSALNCTLSSPAGAGCPTLRLRSVLN